VLKCWIAIHFTFHTARYSSHQNVFTVSFFFRAKKVQILNFVCYIWIGCFYTNA